MFDYSMRANLKSVKVEVEDAGATIKRVCRMQVELMLESEIARAIGGDFGAEALQALRDLTSTKVEFPIDAITAKGRMVGIPGTTPVLLKEIVGIKAVASSKKPKEDEDPDPPKVKLEFQFDYSNDVWVFLGNNMGAWVDLTLSKNQLELDLPGPMQGWSVPLLTPEQAAKAAAVGEEIGKSVAAEMAKHAVPTNGHTNGNGHHHGDERDVHETAESPEEAEELRAARLAQGPTDFEDPDVDESPEARRRRAAALAAQGRDDLPTDNDEGNAF